MKNAKDIIMLLAVIGLAGVVVFLLTRKPEGDKKQTPDATPTTQPQANTTHTNISMTAEGKPFSTLYGISQIINSLNPLMQSIPGLFNAIKNPNNNTLIQDCVKQKLTQNPMLGLSPTGYAQAMAECKSI